METVHSKLESALMPRRDNGAYPFLMMPVKALKDWPMLESEGDMKSPARRVRPGPLASSCSIRLAVSHKDQDSRA